MEKVSKVLDIMTSMSNNMRVRDRSVKVIQYGSQMLVGFYASKFSDETIVALKNLRRSASTSRKAFWLLKSVNHISVMTKLLSNYKMAGESITFGLDVLEQFALVLYFWFENLVFLARHNLVGFSEDSVDLQCNATWFIGDLACFCATGFRFLVTLKDSYQQYKAFMAAKQQSQYRREGSLSFIKTENSKNSFDNVNLVELHPSIDHLELELAKSAQAVASGTLSFSIVSIFCSLFLSLTHSLVAFINAGHYGARRVLRLRASLEASHRAGFGRRPR